MDRAPRNVQLGHIELRVKHLFHTFPPYVDAARSWLTANAFLLSVSTISQMIVVIGANENRAVAPPSS
jgi:hypothetical protein